LYYFERLPSFLSRTLVLKLKELESESDSTLSTVDTQLLHAIKSRKELRGKDWSRFTTVQPPRRATVDTEINNIAVSSLTLIP